MAGEEDPLKSVADGATAAVINAATKPAGRSLKRIAVAYRKWRRPVVDAMTGIKQSRFRYIRIRMTSAGGTVSQLPLERPP